MVEGVNDGSIVGCAVGVIVGSPVGLSLGEALGISEGFADGPADGANVGVADGVYVYASVGAKLEDGSTECKLEGRLLGSVDGSKVTGDSLGSTLGVQEVGS